MKVALYIILGLVGLVIGGTVLWYIFSGAMSTAAFPFRDPGVVSLMNAVRADDKTKAEEILKGGVNVDARGDDDVTPLLWTMGDGKGGNINEFKMLVDLGANPNTQFKEGVPVYGGQTMVTLAAKHEDPAYLEYLLDHGGDPNAKTLEGKSALQYAADTRSSTIEHIQLLLNHNADINITDAGGLTVIFNVVELNQFATANFLLDHGASIKLHGDNGERLLSEVTDTTISQTKFPEMYAEQKKLEERIKVLMLKK